VVSAEQSLECTRTEKDTQEEPSRETYGLGEIVHVDGIEAEKVIGLEAPCCRHLVAVKYQHRTKCAVRAPRETSPQRNSAPQSEAGDQRRRSRGERDGCVRDTRPCHLEKAHVSPAEQICNESPAWGPQSLSEELAVKGAPRTSRTVGRRCSGDERI